MVIPSPASNLSWFCWTTIYTKVFTPSTTHKFRSEFRASHPISDFRPSDSSLLPATRSLLQTDCSQQPPSDSLLPTERSRLPPDGFHVPKYRSRLTTERSRQPPGRSRCPPSRSHRGIVQTDSQNALSGLLTCAG